MSDYIVVGILQISALSYGLFSAFEARPVFIVFAVDRFELISQVDLAETKTKITSQEFETSFWGPKLVSVKSSENLQEKNQILFESVLGGFGLAS